MSLAGEKGKRFAVRIVKLYQYLTREKKEYILSKQLLRSGTSIGANLAEADYGMSRKDFLSKMSIALKEVSETIYWIDLLHETDYLTEAQYSSLYADGGPARVVSGQGGGSDRFGCGR